MMQNKKLTSLLLCLMLCIGNIPPTVFAADNEQQKQSKWVFYVGEERDYKSIQSVLDSENITSDEPFSLRIILQGAPADTGEISIPTNKNIAGVTIASEEDTNANVNSVNIYANGVPLTIEGGTFTNCKIFGGGNQKQVDETDLVIEGGVFDSGYLIGGCKDASATNTNLTVNGGTFQNNVNLYGGSYRTKDDTEVRITDTSSLTINDVTGAFNYISGGSSIMGSGNSDIRNILVNITNSSLTYDSLIGGSSVSVKSGTYEGHSIGSISMTVDNSILATKSASANGFYGGSIYSDNNKTGTNSGRLYTGNIELNVKKSDVSKTQLYVLDSMYLNGNGVVDNVSFAITDSSVNEIYQCYAGNNGCVYEVGDIFYTLENISSGSIFPVGAYGLFPESPGPAPSLSTNRLSLTLKGEIAKEQGITIFPKGYDMTPDTPSTVILNNVSYVISATTKVILADNIDEISVVPPEGKYIKTCTVNETDQTPSIEEDGRLTLTKLRANDTLFVEMADGCKVSYAFESGTPGKDLPESIAKGLLPVANRVYAPGTVVTPKAPEETEKAEIDSSSHIIGTWKFEGYDVENVTLNADVTFTGVWKFIPAALSAPSDLQWDNTTPGKAVWEKVNGADGYLIELYKENTSAPISKVETTNSFYDFSTTITQKGSYTFKVKALSSTGSDSDFSDWSGKLHTVFLNDGESSSLQLIRNGEKAKAPVPPAKENYTFGGWYNELLMWDFTNRTILEPISLTAKWLSQNTGINAVTINGVSGVIEGNIIRVELPAGLQIPTEKDKISITLSDTKASYGDTLSTSDSGRTWAFTVTAEDSAYQKDYTILVYVEESSQSTQEWTIAVSAGDGGTVTGGGTYADGLSVTVKATPNSQYQFIRWEENGKEVSTKPEYSFIASKNRTLTAIFQSEGERTSPQTGDNNILALWLALIGVGAAGIGWTIIYSKKKKHSR